ncbi:FtsX-like permease family protein [Chitinophagaceae bacterium LB-8]|uniref:FtsX-like permease family protein n=1 Tax=Paraflavisolibacter caeni TaxID=2982496 RepID=A0A9X2XMT5_9BACT|nr:FtsX-like permease family protein [Paraflavisolibacter caeni]MCU7547933.1 FtsX-like permease family protein [Paraflavisolibacter caeni]
MNFLFAWRYFKAKKTTNAINIIAWISILAIIIGTASLILVLSVFNGFEDLVKSLYSSFYPDIRVSPATGKQITLSQEQLNKIRSVKGVMNISLVAEEKALLQNGEFQSIIYLKGVDDQYTKVTGVSKHIVKGNFRTGDADFPLLVLGAGIENAVAVQSDRSLAPLVVYLPKKSGVDLSNPLNSISADTINTSGTFLIQQDFDNKYAITNLEFLKRMLGLGADQYGAAELILNQDADPDEVKENLAMVLGNHYLVQTRYEQNQSLYSVMRAEKWVIYAILSLILVVAAFNMIGALTMLVLEKQQDISVLHALGGSRSFIQKIFLSEGVLLAVIGGCSGMLVAVILAVLQVNFKLIPLQGGTFLIDYFPVKLSLSDFLLVGITVLVIAVLASWLPARKAARQEFSLRSE